MNQMHTKEHTVICVYIVRGSVEAHANAAL